MKIGIQTWGSNGDIRPMIALANDLQNVGHAVTLVVSSLDNRSYAEQCDQFNIGYQQIPDRFDFDLQDFAQQTFKMNGAQWLIALLENAFFPYEDLIYSTAKQLVEENDLVIGHHFLYPLKLAALKQSVPHVSVTLCHAAISSTSQPPFRFPNLGKSINTFQWRLFNGLFDLLLKKKLTRLWNNEGMPAINQVLPQLLTSDTLNLVAVDPEFCPTHNEWSPQHHACGFFNLPQTDYDWSIPTLLQDFLNAGDPPVYMTFGSLQQAVPEWSMDLFLKAVRLSGCRAIIQTSSSQYPENTQQNNVYFIGRHPHQALFEHCAAVVHHGGAGITHTATLCGLPSIVIPFMDEQLFWACTLQQRFCAPKPLPAKKATAKQLASRLKTVLSDSRYKETADKLGKQIKNRNGVSHAVALIENLDLC